MEGSTDEDDFFGLLIDEAGVGSDSEGNGSKECPDYDPTPEELEELARYWAGQIVDVRWALYSSVGRSGLRLLSHAKDRFYEISSILGADVCEKIFEEAEEGFCEDWSEEEREAYLHGDRRSLNMTMEDEYERLEINQESLLAAIRSHGRVSCATLQKELSATLDQIWWGIYHLVMNGRVICFDAGAAITSPEALEVWIPTDESNRAEWVRSAREPLLRAKRLYDAMKRSGRRDAREKEAVAS